MAWAEAVAVLVADVGGQYRRLSRIDVACRMGAPDIFVSYAREDQARVAPVVAALEARGWSVFWDRRIPAGQTWRSHIGRALEQARCVVVAWSEHSIKSDWVIEEADEGKRRGILVPVLLDAVLPPRGFRGIQAADLSSWSPKHPSPAFDNFLADLLIVLGPPHPGPSPLSPAIEIPRAKPVVAPQSLSSRAGSKAGRWWLGMALAVGVISAGGYAYLGSFTAQYGRALERAGNNAEAIRWYQQAADQGNAAAQFKLTSLGRAE
jgi:TIR domain